MKDEKEEVGEDISEIKNGDGVEEENLKADDENIDSANQEINSHRSQKSEVKEQPKEPIEVSLKERPTV
jgi:hypothetical protein